jgi:HAD superfamily hydrolase (TIGR01458 family)
MRDGIRGVALDLEGVLYGDEGAFDGAARAVSALRERGLALRFLTNTTTRPRREIVERLAGHGIVAAADEVLSPAVAAAGRLRAAGCARVHLAAAEGLAEDLEGLPLVEEDPDAVLLGDLHRAFDWDRLDRLFGMLRGGARLVALHKNRYCRREGRIALDLGPFVAALEYAARVEAEVVGKPSALFFESAVEGMGLSAGEVVMVGDDIEADIAGALGAGLAAVQVRTGKYTGADNTREDVRPTARIGSIAGLPDWLGL